MYYIVGLGNPGEEYLHTRHNVGFKALDALLSAFSIGEPVKSSKFVGRLGEGVVDGEEVVLLYPDTFMNKSGSAVQKLVPKAEINKLIVIYDDVHLPIGSVRISFGRGDGGHNGIKSIIDGLGSRDFVRVRIGVAEKSFWGGVKKPSGDKLAKFVLAKFKKREEETLTEVLDRTVEIVKVIIDSGVENAMNQFN
ncbi:aminoacyl-tRNA hydrolase [Candidatus Kaiserbacteria bacterium]|nr:aminoacyl-tRNA hydrolase [Candidatus Kaiserbacteria bacterium]